MYIQPDLSPAFLGAANFTSTSSEVAPQPALHGVVLSSLSRLNFLVKSALRNSNAGLLHRLLILFGSDRIQGAAPLSIEERPVSKRKPEPVLCLSSLSATSLQCLRRMPGNSSISPRSIPVCPRLFAGRAAELLSAMADARVVAGMSKKTYATQSPSPDAKTPLHLSSNANGQLRYGLIGVQAGATAPNFSRGKLEAVGK